MASQMSGLRFLGHRIESTLFRIRYIMPENLSIINNLVPRALFPTPKAREKRPGDEVVLLVRTCMHA